MTEFVCVCVCLNNNFTFKVKLPCHLRRRTKKKWILPQQIGREKNQPGKYIYWEFHYQQLYHLIFSFGKTVDDISFAENKLKRALNWKRMMMMMKVEWKKMKNPHLKWVDTKRQHMSATAKILFKMENARKSFRRKKNCARCWAEFDGAASEKQSYEKRVYTIL